MRYEAKHSYFKRLAKNAYNFKNIAKTLAKRHQRLMCYYLNSPGEGHGFLDEATSTGKGQFSPSIILISLVFNLVIILFLVINSKPSKRC